MPLVQDLEREHGVVGTVVRAFVGSVEAQIDLMRRGVRIRPILEQAAGHLDDVRAAVAAQAAYNREHLPRLPPELVAEQTALYASVEARLSEMEQDLVQLAREYAQQDRANPLIGLLAALNALH
jgi:hypothetical protein